MREIKLKNVDPERILPILKICSPDLTRMTETLKSMGIETTQTGLLAKINNDPRFKDVKDLYNKRKREQVGKINRLGLLNPQLERQIVAAGLKKGLTPQEIAKEDGLLLTRVCLIARNILNESNWFFLRGKNPRFPIGKKGI